MLEPVEVIGAMIAPAALISAAALLLLSTANRLGRVNDRLLHLVAEAEKLYLPEQTTAAVLRKRHLLEQQVSGLAERLLLLRSAVNGIYAAMAIFAVTSITGGMYVVFPQMTNLVPISLGMLGGVAFLYSIATLLQEAAVATRLTMHEIDYVHKLLPSEQ